MLADIGKGGEKAVRDYAAKRDQWSGDIVVTPTKIERRTSGIPSGTRRDIEFSIEQVRRFASEQRASMRALSTEVRLGRIVAQRPIPGNVAGSNLTTGRYAHIASAYMSIATSKAVGVPTWS